MPCETIVLTDEQTGSRASILVGLGFNCYRFEPVVDGQRYDVLWAADGFELGDSRPSGSGIPLLFPFPGRIGEGRFRYHGRSFELPTGDGRGNAIHGFVYDRPWHVVERHGARLVGRFQFSRDAPELLKQWPADAVLTIAFEVRGGALILEAIVENPDERPLPFGFGIHPYFRASFEGGSSLALRAASAQRTLIHVPADSYWVLDSRLLPTGEKRPVDEARDLREPRPLDRLELDDVFGDLRFDNGKCTASVRDASVGHTVRLQFDDQHCCCVVYTPPHREAVCIEPYTCLPDAIRLAERGLEAGLRELRPGERFATRLEIALT